MRPLLRLLAVAGLVTLLAAPAAALAAAPAPSAAAAPGHAPALPAASAIAQDALAARDWNTTLAAPHPGSGGAPTSALFTTPAPVVPDTKPVVMYFANNSVATASTNCCVFANFTAPVGPWAMIVLNYTGSAEIDVFDSSYRAYIDQSMVLFGTTPEYGTWTVLKDITEYSALFHGTFNLSFFMSAAIPSGSGGYFLSSFSIAFYPVPTGGQAPMEPNTILPLWFRQSVTPSNPSIYVATDVPTNTTNATLELYAYGFGPDEFWYNTQPGYRSIQVAENGTDVAAVLPFQYVNTGGMDPFTWRPITGMFTLDDRPYQLNVTAALGLLEGPRNLTARLTGVSAGSDWIIAGSLLLSTSPLASAATTSSYVWSALPPIIRTGSGTYTETGGVEYNYSSEVGLPGGPVNVTLNRTVAYISAQTFGQMWIGESWSNLTAIEETSTLISSQYPSGTVTANVTTAFDMDLDYGSAFVESSSNNGSYPIYGNYTIYLDDVRQQWSESTEVTGPAASYAYSGSVLGLDTAGTNVYSGPEELISANAAYLLGTPSVQSQTSQLFGQDVTAANGGGLYNHLLEGASLNAVPPYQAETILLDAASSPLVAGLSLSASTVDTGHPVTISLAVSGGSGPYAVTWTGLPPGCTPTDSATVTCAPTQSGIYFVTATAQSSSGAVALAPERALLVNPSPSVTLSAPTLSSDVGVAINVTAVVTGGTPALSCAWTVGGSPAGPATSCATPLAVSRTTTSLAAVDVTVTDSVGVSVTPPGPLTLAFGEGPAILIEPVANTTPYVDHPVTLTAESTGGAGAVSIFWTVNGTAVPGATGATYTFVPFGAANYTIGATVEDSVGVTALSAAVTISSRVAPASPGGSSTGGNGGGSSGGGSSGLPPVAYVAVGIAIGAVFGVLLMLLAGPRRPPTARPRPRPAAPPPYDEGP